MDARLLPDFAYSANPYLVAQNAEWITSWGFPNLFVPAAPFGFAGTPPTYGFQYVSGLPVFQFQPSGIGAIFQAFQGGMPPYPYVTTAEAAYNSATQAGIYGTYLATETLSGLLTFGLYSAMFSKAVGGRVFDLLARRLPFLGAVPGLLEGVPLVGRFLAGMAPEVIGGSLLSMVAGPLIGGALGYIASQAGQAVGGITTVENSLQQVLIGTNEFDYFRNSLTPGAAAHIYEGLLQTATENPLTDRDTLLNILSAAPQLGLFEFTHHDTHAIIQAVKGIASILRVVSEMARDPSMMDTLQRVAEFVRSGYAIQQGLALYHELGIYAQAGGAPLASIWEQEVVPVAQAFAKSGLWFSTGALVAVQMKPFLHAFGPYAFEEGLAPYLRTIGGLEGYQQLMMQNLIFYASNPLAFWLDKGRLPTGMEEYLRWDVHRPEEFNRMVTKYGAPQVALNYQIEFIERLKSLGLSDDAILKLAKDRQIPVDLVTAEAYLGGKMGAYREALLHSKVAEQQARIHDVINQAEIYSESLPYKIQRWKATLAEWVQHPFVKLESAISKELETFREEYRFYPEELGPLGRLIGNVLLGPTPELFKQRYYLSKRELHTLEALQSENLNVPLHLLEEGTRYLPERDALQIIHDFLPLARSKESELIKLKYTYYELFTPEERERLKKELQEAYRKHHHWGRAIIEVYEKHRDEFLQEYQKQDQDKVRAALVMMAYDMSGKKSLNSILLDLQVQLASLQTKTPNRTSEVLKRINERYEELTSGHLTVFGWDSPLEFTQDAVKVIGEGGHGLLGESIRRVLIDKLVKATGKSADEIIQIAKTASKLDIEDLVRRAKHGDPTALKILGYIATGNEDFLKGISKEQQTAAAAYRDFLQMSYKYDEDIGRVYRDIKAIYHGISPESVMLADTSRHTEATIAERMAQYLAGKDWDKHKKEVTALLTDLASFKDVKTRDEFEELKKRVVEELNKLGTPTAHKLAEEIQHARSVEEAKRIVVSTLQAVNAVKGSPAEQQPLVQALSQDAGALHASLQKLANTTWETEHSLNYLAEAARRAGEQLETLARTNATGPSAVNRGLRGH